MSEKPLTRGEIIRILAENQRSVTKILEDHEKRLKNLEKEPEEEEW